MAALLFGAAQSAAIMVEGERDSVRIHSLLMQINADTVCLVRTQFQQQLISMPAAAMAAFASLTVNAP